MFVLAYLAGADRCVFEEEGLDLAPGETQQMKPGCAIVECYRGWDGELMMSGSG